MQFKPNYPANIRRFAVAVAVMEYFAFKELDPYYLQFMTTDRGSRLTPLEFGFFVSSGEARTFQPWWGRGSPFPPGEGQAFRRLLKEDARWWEKPLLKASSLKGRS